MKMDDKRPQVEPAEAQSVIQQRLNNKLAQRKKEIQRHIWAKRNPISPILGYDLSKKKRKRKYRKSCWCYGSTCHLISTCPVHRESLLKKRVSELERKVEALEKEMKIKRQNIKKTKKRKRKKKIKKRRSDTS